MARRPAAQDDVRENRIVDLFNLVRPLNRVRHGTDALLMIDGFELEFELKSVTTGGGISTVRDLGPDHIAKWKDKHWIVAVYEDGELFTCRYGSPSHMEPWIERIWAYIADDFGLANLVPAKVDLTVARQVLGDKEQYTLADARALQKNQMSASEYAARMDVDGGYSPERMLEFVKERVRYLIERGSTLNNPHIPAGFIQTWPEIRADHAQALRDHVREWLAATPAEQLALLGRP